MKLLNIAKSNRRDKKYVADVLHNGVIHRNVHFGHPSYQQFRDATPLKLYSYLDHNDTERRRRYHLRHKKNVGIASELSKRFLW